MGLNDFPPELLGHVVSFLWEGDLKQLRLVCKSFEAIATPPLFSHLTMWLQATCLERLGEVVKHGRLRYLVQSLTIGNEWLDTVPPSPERFIYEFVLKYVQPAQRSLTYPGLFTLRTQPLGITRTHFGQVTIDRFQRLDPSVLNDLNTLGWGPNRLFAAYKECGKMILDHYTLIEQEADTSSLSRVIEGLPNLRKVVITATIEIDKLQVNQTVRRDLFDPSGTPCFGKYRSWGVSAVADHVIAVRPRQDGRHLDVFIRALSRLYYKTSLSINISELHVDESIWGDQGLELGGYNVGRIDPKITSMAVQTLRQLNTLSLPLGSYGDGLADLSIGHRAAQFLRDLPRLEYLAVQSFYMCPQEDAEAVLQAISTKSLCSLILGNFVFKGSTLMKFLERHGETLKEVVLTNARLHGCRLQELFRFMREKMSIENLVLERDLSEFRHDCKLEPYTDSAASELQQGLTEPGFLAKSSIAEFVTKKSDRYPIYVLLDGVLRD